VRHDTGVQADEAAGPAPAPGNPPVLPFDVRRGWELADRPRRAFALAGPAAFGLWWLVLLAGEPLWAVNLAALAVLTAGPPGCYSIARILRPHTAVTSGERVLRHWTAATALALGAATMTALLVEPLDAGAAPTAMVLFGGVPALLSVPVTLCWAGVAAGWRARRHPGAEHADQPGRIPRS